METDRALLADLARGSETGPATLMQRYTGLVWSVAPDRKICAKTIALHCNCSENAAQDTIKRLVGHGFICKVATKQARRDGSWRKKMVEKCVNKTKGNNQRPVGCCETLCRAVRDLTGPRSLLRF